MSKEKNFVVDKKAVEDDESLKEVGFKDFEVKGFEPSDGDSPKAGVAAAPGLSPSELDAVEKRVKRKVDMRLMVCLWCIVFLDGLDLGALPLAKVDGIQKSLHMSSDQFSAAISILSVGGIVMQIPSNMFLTRVRPSIYLPCAAVTFGTITLITGFLQSAGALLALRFVLGCVEAVFIPGSLLIVSSWYKRDELGVRGALIFSAVHLSSAFGGLVAASVQQLEGVNGLQSWRWMFIIEGSVTILVAIIAFFILPDYPRNTRWLTPVERAVAEWRLTKDAGGQTDEDDLPMLTGLKLALKDWRLYLFAFMVFSITVTGSTMSFFPAVVQTLGFDTTETDLLTIPPSLIGIVVGLANNWSADRTANASFHVMWPSAAAILGFILIVAGSSNAVRYFAMILITGVGDAGVIHAWVQKTILRPRAKRASAVAFAGTVVNIARIWTPFMYRDAAAPRYVLAMTVNTVFALLAILGAVAMRFILLRANKKLDREAIELDDGSASENGSPKKGFRYIA